MLSDPFNHQDSLNLGAHAVLPYLSEVGFLFRRQPPVCLLAKYQIRIILFTPNFVSIWIDRQASEAR
jgi:hypothetical protein